jgi:hypothetical protein
MTTNGTNGTHQLPEAPASATVKALSANGFEVLFTIRDHDAAQLFTRLQSLVGYLEKSGYTPPAARGGKPKGPPPMQAPADGSAPMCPTHQKPMKASQYGGWYCSHKDDAGYCSQKAK